MFSAPSTWVCAGEGRKEPNVCRAGADGVEVGIGVEIGVGNGVGVGAAVAVGNGVGVGVGVDVGVGAGGQLLFVLGVAPYGSGAHTTQPSPPSVLLPMDVL